MTGVMLNFIFPFSDLSLIESEFVLPPLPELRVDYVSCFFVRMWGFVNIRAFNYRYVS
jgi:hypothetical protein